GLPRAARAVHQSQVPHVDHAVDDGVGGFGVFGREVIDGPVPEDLLTHSLFGLAALAILVVGDPLRDRLADRVWVAAVQTADAESVAAPLESREESGVPLQAAITDVAAIRLATR